MKKRFATNLHRLSVRQVQVALDGDYTDGGGLINKTDKNRRVQAHRPNLAMQAVYAIGRDAPFYQSRPFAKTHALLSGDFAL